MIAVPVPYVEEPDVCLVEGCASRIFTRTERGVYEDVVTRIGWSGELRVDSHGDDLTETTPWVCENGHAQEGT